MDATHSLESNIRYSESSYSEGPKFLHFSLEQHGFGFKINDSQQ